MLILPFLFLAHASRASRYTRRVFPLPCPCFPGIKVYPKGVSSSYPIPYIITRLSLFVKEAFFVFFLEIPPRVLTHSVNQWYKRGRIKNRQFYGWLLVYLWRSLCHGK
jgi:hypothetical protein